MAAENDRPDTIEFVIPGARMVHVITVVTKARTDLAIEVLQAVQSAGAGLEGMTSSRYGEHLDHLLRLSGIGATQARAVCHQISRLPGICAASVDHHFTAPLPELSSGEPKST